jgi:hypothetical protein
MVSRPHKWCCRESVTWAEIDWPCETFSSADHSRGALLMSPMSMFLPGFQESLPNPTTSLKRGVAQIVVFMVRMFVRMAWQYH